MIDASPAQIEDVLFHLFVLMPNLVHDLYSKMPIKLAPIYEYYKTHIPATKQCLKGGPRPARPRNPEKQYSDRRLKALESTDVKFRDLDEKLGSYDPPPRRKYIPLSNEFWQQQVDKEKERMEEVPIFPPIGEQLDESKRAPFRRELKENVEESEEDEDEEEKEVQQVEEQEGEEEDEEAEIGEPIKISRRPQTPSVKTHLTRSKAKIRNSKFKPCRDMTVVELRAELKSYRAKQTGSKNDLCRRLQYHRQKHNY